MSLFLSSCPCLYWQFTLTANSSPSTHSLLTISLTTVPGHFQSDLNAQTNYLINSGSFTQTEIQDKQDEVSLRQGGIGCSVAVPLVFKTGGYHFQSNFNGTSGWIPPILRDYKWLLALRNIDPHPEMYV